MSNYSPFVIKALVDVITGSSGNAQPCPIGIYRTGTAIEQFFLDCGLDMRISGQSRVAATTDFLRHTANQEDGDQAFERIMLRVADPRDYAYQPEKARAVVDHLNVALAADGFAITLFDGKPQLVTKLLSGAVVTSFGEKAALLNFDTVEREVARALASVENDPEDAITSACSLVEAVCRSILIELELTLPPKKDIDGLVRAVQQPLGLSPGRNDLPAEIEADVRQVLGGLTSVAKGIGALRTHAGDAHGREKGFRRVDAIHWRPTDDFCAKLDAHGFAVVVLTRHPLDVLLSILQFAPKEPQTARWLDGEHGNEEAIYGQHPNSPIFMDYATGMRARALLSISREWSIRPGVIVVRFEELVEDTAGVLERLTRSIAPLLTPIDDAIKHTAFVNLKQSSSNGHFWKGSPGLWRSLFTQRNAEMIRTAHDELFDDLGYDVSGAEPTAADDGEKRRLWSHAQNFEDVILWRALKDVVGGFYIDIGAQDPVVDSVSLAFYEKGWRGVHVEPVPEYAERLRNARPDEQVIEAIVDARTGWRVFYEFPGTGLSTGSRKIAERHAKSGLEFRKVSVPCLPLSAIFDGHGKRDIHWLKIDVEGMERQVIQSWGDASARPWVILIESTKPLFKTPTFAQWEPLLLERAYEFVYFDGLNRFYVSNEHRELKEGFGPGPNVFDDFVLSGRASAPFCARLNDEIRAAQHRLGESEANAARLTQVAEELRNGTAAERASFVGAAAAWENVSAALTEELAAKGHALAASQAHIATLEARIGGLDAQRAQLDGLVLERDRHIAVLDGRTTELDREVARLNGVLSERDRHIAAADAQMTDINQEVGRLKSELSATTGALAERDREIALIESQSAQLLNETALLKAELSAQAGALAERDREVALIESQSAQLLIETVALKATLSARVDSLAERNREAALLSSRVDELDAAVRRQRF